MIAVQNEVVEMPTKQIETDDTFVAPKKSIQCIETKKPIANSLNRVFRFAFISLFFE